MARVPRDRYGHLEALRSGRKKAIIVGGVPIPAGEDSLSDPLAKGGRLFWRKEGYKISSQSELVSTFESPRFRNTFGEQATLSQGMAESLEDFEQGLRLAGLIGPQEVLLQSYALLRKFRVKQLDVSDDFHGIDPSGKAASPSGTGPALPEDHKQTAGGPEGVKGEERQRPLTPEDHLPPRHIIVQLIRRRRRKART